MKAGDIVRYRKVVIVTNGNFYEPVKDDWSPFGLLLEFDKTQRTCRILDSETSEIVVKHCSDVQLKHALPGNRSVAILEKKNELERRKSRDRKKN